MSIPILLYYDSPPNQEILLDYKHPSCYRACEVRNETKCKTVEHFLLLYSNESKGLPWCSSPFLTTAALACLVTHLRNSWRSGSIFDVEYKSDRKKCFHYLNSWKHFPRSKVVCLVPNFRERPTRLLQSSHLYCVLEETSNRQPFIKIPENIYMCLSRTAI